MKLDLNVWQLLNLIGIIGTVEGSVQNIRKADKILDILELTDAEKEQIGYKFDATTGSITWTDYTIKFGVDIPDPNLGVFLVERVRLFKWPEAAWSSHIVRKQIVDLYDQLGIKDEA